MHAASLTPMPQDSGPKMTVGRGAHGQNVEMSWGDRLALLTLFLVPTPSFLGEAIIRIADAVRVAAVTGRMVVAPSFSISRHFARSTGILVLFLLGACCSLLMGISQTTRDLMDVARIGIFLSVFVYAASLALRNGLHPTPTLQTFRLLLGIGVLDAAFTAIQLVFPILSRPATLLYSSAESRHIELMGEQGRAIGFFVNPNTNAMMLLLLSLAAIPLFHQTRRRSYQAMGLFVFFSALLTASRTAIILWGVIACVYCIGSGRIRNLFLLGLASVGAYLVVDYLVVSGMVRVWFPYLSELLIKVHASVNGSAFELESISSFRGRIEIWEDTLIWFHQSPVFGAGPLRSVMHSFADSYYIYLLSRYGMVGLTMYAAFNVYIGWLAIGGLLRGNSLLRDVSLTMLCASSTLNVANYTMDAFPIVPIAGIYLVLAGYLVGLSDLWDRNQAMDRLKRSTNVASSIVLSTKSTRTTRGMPAVKEPFVARPAIFNSATTR